MQRPESFEKFYYTRVGMGEACGCAERIIDVYEFNRTGGRPKTLSGLIPKRRFSFRRFGYKWGLISRPKSNR